MVSAEALDKGGLIQGQVGVAAGLVQGLAGDAGLLATAACSIGEMDVPQVTKVHCILNLANSSASHREIRGLSKAFTAAALHGER